jgi:DNA primase
MADVGYEPQQIDDVRRAVDIVTVVGETVALRRRGRKLWGLCPFHNEKTPSFTVDPERQLFYCFGCHKGGNVFTYVMERDHRTFPEALELLAERAGIALRQTGRGTDDRRDRLRAVLEACQEFFRRALKTSAAGRAALADRGVGEAWVDRFGLGYAPDRWDALTGWLEERGFAADDMVAAGVAVRRDRGGVYDRMRHRITFPIMDGEGRLVGFGGRAVGPVEPKYLNSPDTPLYQKGRILYRADLSRETWRRRPPIVVEGYFDVIACHQAGLTEAVASLGTALTADHVRLLQRYTDRVVLGYDNDRAGDEAAERAFLLLAQHGLAVTRMVLADVKDVDELLRRDGPDAVRQAAEEAVPYVGWRIRQEVPAARRGPAAKAAAWRRIRPLLLAVADPVEREGHIQLVERLWAVEPGSLAQALRKAQGGGEYKGGNFRHNMGRQPEKFGLTTDRDRAAGRPSPPGHPGRQKDDVNLLGWLIQFPDEMEGVLATLPELCKDMRWADIVAAWPHLGQMSVADWVGQLPDGARELAAEAAMVEGPASAEAVRALAQALKRRRQEERWQELQNRAAAGPVNPDLEREILALWSQIREAKQTPRKEG